MKRKVMLKVFSAFLVASLALVLANCSSGGGGSTPPPATTFNPVYTGNTTTVTVQPASAVTTTMQTSNTNVSSLGFTFPPNAVSAPTVVSVAEVALTSIPAHAAGFKAATNSANIDITAFTISTNPPSVTIFNVPVSVNGNVVTSATVTIGTTLNLAMLQNNSWVDVSTLTVGVSGALVQNLASTSLPGILSPGTYLLYKPAAGSSTAVSNLGIALIADDGYGYSSANSGNPLQVINLYDASGAPLATPTIKYLYYSGAGDMDGQALTPDGSQGIIVDGGNTVRFFSNVQTGVPLASTVTVDISAYGGDGDSVAIMPNGDEAVVSGDSSNVLLLVSGILSGNPQAATTIPIPGYRDGVLITDDGKVLLARGSSGLTVFAIAPITSQTGTLGGAVSHSFTQTMDFTSGIVTPSGEDGRDGVAISPASSSRAVLIGSDPTSYTPAIQLISGLPNAPVAANAVAVAGATSVFSVTITPDGKKAIVGTNAGIAMFSGVDTGSLMQVGTAPYAPTYAGSSGSVTLGTIATLGITLDGKYAVVCDSGSYSGSSSGSLLVIPITTTGFSTPVGILNGIAVPYNDQMVIH